MERLTARGSEGYAYFPKCFEDPCGGEGCQKEYCEFLNAVCDRLAAYEDTGLEPETAAKIRDVVLNISGDIDRLRELVQAKKDGRLVMLPCYTGDKVYMPFLGKILELEVENVVLNGGVTTIYYYSSSLRSSPDDFGKTVFLTHEEAAAALKGESNETNPV